MTFLSNVQVLKDSETAFQGPYERHRERNILSPVMRLYLEDDIRITRK